MHFFANERTIEQAGPPLLVIPTLRLPYRSHAPVPYRSHAPAWERNVCRCSVVLAGKDIIILARRLSENREIRV
jgi:hypothetical protein